MNKWLEKPWAIRAVALILSVLLFVVVAFDENVYDNDGLDLSLGNTNETQTLEDVPVQIHLDQEQYVVSGVPETVTVSLQGSLTLVTSTARQRNFDVFVDLEDLGVGTHRVALDYFGIPDGLNAYIEPQEIEVTIEERHSQSFNVAIDTVNREQIAPGYEVSNIYAEPSEVQVTSSKSVIDKIAIVKAFVDVTGLDDTQTINNVPVKVYDNQGNELSVRIDPPTTNVTVDVKNPSKMAPISVETENELPEDMQLVSIEPEAEEVEVFAAESYLEQLNEIATEPIDLSQITESDTIEVELAPSSEVRLLGSETVNVNIEVELIEEEELENVAIDYDSPEGQTVTFVEPSSDNMNVTMRGYPSDMSEINADDLQLSIDIGNRSPGEHQLPVKFEAPEDVPDNLEFELEFDEVTVNIQ
ncbi:CdaR family protein [Gracilibacillus alcaliphilus]|uniref:CdaR family protein n=1 Tax=Gracilibacillus alcaliphilus TaxID=1401441 RepID=UPI001957B5C1|nr:CdaR family protein [Gracilibacillus alcaliphilus]MBM7678023.1 YbbR domain-containing protein [Gracilibacillus alcaliphilus]